MTPNPIPTRPAHSGPIRRSLLVLACVSICAALPVLAGANLTLAPGDKAPELRGTSPRGERLIPKMFGEQRWTLVNFWATWCEPCKGEMPTLQGLHEKYPERLQIVGVIKDPIDDASLVEFLDTLGVTYPNMRPQPRYDAQWAGSGSLPTSFLIDPTGKIVRRYVGAAGQQTAGLVYDIEAAIDGRPLGPYVFPPAPEEKDADEADGEDTAGDAAVNEG